MTKLPSATKILTAFSIILILALPVLSIHPVFATHIFEDGFETGDFSKWSPVVGTPTVTSGEAHHGTYKAVLSAASQYAQARFTLTPVDRCFMRAYVMFMSFPASGTETTVLGVYNWASSRYMAEVRVGNFSGIYKWRLRYYDNGVHYTVTSEQQKPVLNTWYCVEVDGKSNSTTNSEARIYINGNELTDISQTGKNNNLPITCGYIWANTAVTRWYDCVVIDAAYIGPECTLTVNVAGSGSVDKTPDQTVYDWGTNVTLTANPTIGWSFDHWSGDASGTVNPVTVNITSDKAVTATFTQDTYTLTVTPVGSGTVNQNNSGPYYYGDVVELTAVPSIGWSFDHWGGDLGGSVNPTTILIDGDKMVTATFTQNVYTLTVGTVGNGNVNLNNTGPYHYGDIVELTAVPVTGWSFQGWSGDLLGSVSPSTILIDGNKAVTATFTQDTYTLTVTTVGSGSVNLNNTGPYYYGDVVQLTAVPATGWSFSAWSGHLSGSANPTTLIIDGNKAATATFTQDTYALTVTTSGSGSVVLNNTGPYHYGDTVQLAANPTVGWSFDHWSGDASGSTNPATIVIDGNKAVTATFTQATYALSVSVAPVGGGFVNLNNSGPYHYGDVVQLTAVPAAGRSFQSWSGDLSGSTSPTTIVISGNKAVTATFTQPTSVGGYSIQISAKSTVQPTEAYGALICLFGAVLAALRRKRRQTSIF